MQIRCHEIDHYPGLTSFFRPQLCESITTVNPKAKIQRALAFCQLGQFTRAEQMCREIVISRPNNTDALHILGLVALETQNFSRAVELLSRVVRIDPRYATAFVNRGSAFQALGQCEAALESYDQALALEPGLAAAAFGRANALYELGRLDEALVAFDRTISLMPDDAQAHCNRGNALRELHQLDAALASYERAIALRGDLAVAHCNRANILSELNSWERALAGYDWAIALNPDYAEAYFNKAMTQLLIEDFENGWVNYEWRLKLKRAPAQNMTEEARFRERRWNGKDSLAGKTILIRSEQGYGDTIQFCRYATVLAGLGAHVILEVQKPLLKLLQPLTGAARVVEAGTPVEFDHQIPMLSLPLAFNTRLDTIPRAGRYLASDPAKVADWESRLGARLRPRVGLVWRGKLQRGDNRSVPLSELAGVLPARFQYVSLQKELSKFDAGVLQAYEIMDYSAELHDFSDTAALCDCMDIVISIDTSIAHLSGADCAWYPTARLYRQNSANAWGEICGRAFADLALTLRS
jgi:tetratricopeptide (TPR) repeat protein